MIDPKLAALITAVSFGIAPVLLKNAFRRNGSMAVGLVTGQAITLLFNVALLVVVDPHVELLSPGPVVAFALGGLMGTAVGRRWAYESINLLGPSRSTTIRSASPVVTSLLAMLVLGEQIGPERWAAILAVVGGAALVSWTPGAGARGWIGLGVAYAMASNAIYGIRPLVMKAGLDQANTPLAAACIGATAALLWTVAFEDRSQLRRLRPDAGFAWFVIAGALQAIGIISLTFGLAGGDASVVYSLTASAPLFTLAFTWLVLRGVEEITPRLVLGTILAIVGVIYL